MARGRPRGRGRGRGGGQQRPQRIPRGQARDRSRSPTQLDRGIQDLSSDEGSDIGPILYARPQDIQPQQDQAQALQGQEIQAQVVQAQGVQAQEVPAQGVEPQGVQARGVEAQGLMGEMRALIEAQNARFEAMMNGLPRPVQVPQEGLIPQVAIPAAAGAPMQNPAMPLQPPQQGMVPPAVPVLPPRAFQYNPPVQDFRRYYTPAIQPPPPAILPQVNPHQPYAFPQLPVNPQVITQGTMAGMQVYPQRMPGENDNNLVAPYLILGTLVDDKIKVMIWEKRFIILGTLLNDSPTHAALAFSWNGENPAIGLAPPKVKNPETFMEWLSLFNTFAAIYTEAHPTEAPALFTYAVRIAELQAMFPRHLVWREYDTNFRKLKARNPNLPWQEHSQSILNSLIPKDNWSMNNNTNNNNGNHPLRKASGGPPPRNACHKYYFRGDCSGESCTYIHLCGHCHKKGHSLHECRQQKGIGRRPQRGKNNSHSKSADSSASE